LPDWAEALFDLEQALAGLEHAAERVNRGMVSLSSVSVVGNALRGNLLDVSTPNRLTHAAADIQRMCRAGTSAVNPGGCALVMTCMKKALHQRARCPQLPARRTITKQAGGNRCA
jgi:hypothetical protein